MCPLRLILIFLSATLAGFFVIRNLKSPSSVAVDYDYDYDNRKDRDPKNNSLDSSRSRFSKVRSAVESGFWTCVDMASGRYLWRHLVSSSSSSSSSSKRAC